AVRREQAAADARQRALARGIGADHPHHFARADRHRRAVHCRGRFGTVAVVKLARLEEQRHLRLHSSATKSGAPIIAVTPRTGGSAPSPRKSTRASASASTRKAAPPSAEAGSTTRWSGPVTRRTA